MSDELGCYACGRHFGTLPACPHCGGRCFSLAQAEAEQRAIAAAVAAEREACAVAAVAAIRHSQQTTDQCRDEVAAAIRARGGK